MIEYDEIIDNLSKIIEVTDNYAYKGVLIANKSAYIAADKVIAKVVFLKRDFTSVIGVPFKKGYEFSEDIYDEHLLKSIKYIDKRIRMYSDTLFYINKNKILNHIKQKYTDKLYGVIIKQEIGDGYGILRIKSRQIQSVLKITSAGFSKINIDITYLSGNENIDTKRIALEPDELEAGFLEDLLEQFILEFKKEINNGTT